MVINNVMLEVILVEIRLLIGCGKVVDYILVLVSVSGDKFGIVISMVDGQYFVVGDVYECFFIQLIFKVLSLVVVMNYYQEEEIWQWVGKDFFGQFFNLFLQLEIEQGKLCNLFINVGVLVVCDMLQSWFSVLCQWMLEIVCCLSGVVDIVYDLVVVCLEFEYLVCNVVIGWLMKFFGNFYNDVVIVLQNYFYYCLLEMSCVELV